jgi:hypothetical protein
MYGPSYGKLTHWKNASAHAWETVGFPRAILVLEAQMTLSEFLKSMVDQILGGESANNNDDYGSFSQALDVGLRKVTNTSECVEFASVFLRQPYSAPPRFETSSLLAIAQAQVSLHGDHLELMQTDPTSLRR